MKRVAVFGGTFDPPHVGHVFAVMWAFCTEQVDEVLVVPSGKHPFGKAPAASFDQRFRMCRLAFRHFRSNTVKVSGIEGKAVGPSYTYETVKAIRDRRPENRLRLLVGSDVPADFSCWHMADELFALAPPMICPRSAISSTAVRYGIKSGNLPREMLPARVATYIEEKKLYIWG